MELSEKQINKFWDILKEHDNISRYSDSQKAEIANGIANFFIISTEISSKKRGGDMEKCIEVRCGKNHEKKNKRK